MRSLKQKVSVFAESFRATRLWTMAVISVANTALSQMSGCAGKDGQQESSSPVAAVSGSGAAVSAESPAAGSVAAATSATGPGPIAGGAAGVGEISATPAGMMGGTPMAPEGSPAWSAIFRDIIVAKGCQGASLCHGGPAGKLMMTTRKAAYDNLVGKAAMGMSADKTSCVDSGLMRVAPSDPDNSLLMQKVRGTHTCGDVMPPNPPMLSPAEIEQIQTWITLGAPYD